METIIYIAIFGVLVIAIRQSIKAIFTLNGINNWIMPVCVSLLALIGMRVMFYPQKATGHDSASHALLLPYAAMGIAIILALIGSWLYRAFHPKTTHEKQEDKNEQRIRIHNPK